MASPQAKTESNEHAKGKKKGKQKKAASAEDGGPGQSSVSSVNSNTQNDLEGVVGPPIQSKGPSIKTIDTEKASTPQKDKQQKKSEKQSKPPQQNKPEGTTTEAGGGEGEKKSKAQLKAERRAVQEKQRALKEAKKAEADGTAGSSGGKKDATTAASKKEKGVDPAKTTSAGGNTKSVRTKKSRNMVDLSSLSQRQLWIDKEKDILSKFLFRSKGSKIDDGIFNLGLQYFHHRIVGANARCVALLTTLKDVIGKYKTPEEKELTRDLEKNFLAPCIKYINDCRPLSTSMGNAIKHLKQQINQIPQGTGDKEAIETLHMAIDNFINTNITEAAKAVAVYANQKIDNGDVILVYAASSLIAQVLKHAHDKGKQFRVIVVEARPRTEGLTMLRYLVQCGISCSYIYIGSTSHAIKEVTKVFLGAAAMFAIGDMHSRTGNAMIAALARSNNIPVLVCCETYKFTEKVQLPEISNQQARGEALISLGHRPPIIHNYEEIDLKLLNVMYDVTPSRYITALVTELDLLPCTSVPVVLRRQEDKIL